MTEPLDEDKELQQRATESEFSGISADSDDPVSYTHLTLPTNREV